MARDLANDLEQLLPEVYDFCATDDQREQAADRRAKEIIQAVQAAAKLQADATLRGQQEIAASINALADAIRRATR